MPYEYRTRLGVVRLVRIRRTWRVEIGGAQAGRWRSADAAIAALIRRSSGLPVLDGLADIGVPEDLLRWTPLAEDL